MFGRDDAEWNELVRVGTAFLEERLRLGRPTSYTEMNTVIFGRTGGRPFDFSHDADRAAMGHLLYLIVQRDYPTRGYMLSAVVMYLDGNDAGSGFYRLGEQMGLKKPGGDRLQFWSEQLRGLGMR
jgi:hypothetical protein